MRRLIALVPLHLLLVTCDDADPAPKNPEANFPASFLWGTATAGFQSDPGCPTLAPEVCEDRASDWYQWVTDPELGADTTTYVTGEPLANGPGMRELYAEDLARAKALGTNAIRISLEWSRLFPDGAAESAQTVDELVPHANADAVAYYRALLAEIERLRLTPLVTLNHYTLPLWIHDGKACHIDLAACEDRGWLDGDRITRAIGLYAGFCARTFGGSVDLWATLNEPFTGIVLAGYVLPSQDRTNPPGVQFQIEAGLAVLKNEIIGHARMVDAVRAEDKVDADGDGKPTRVGTVQNIAAFVPKDPNDPAGADAARHASWVVNELFLEGVATGRLDENIDGVLEDPRPDLVGRLDWIGINYYTDIPVTPFPGGLAPGYAWLDFIPSLEGGFFHIYPEGIYQALALVNRFGLPMIITENGAVNPGPDTGDTFLLPHLRQVHRAMSEGMPVEGYFYWTLVDNYEWNHGMSLKLGLYALDLASKTRTLRPIGERYRDIVRDRGF